MKGCDLFMMYLQNINILFIYLKEGKEYPGNLQEHLTQESDDIILISLYS